LSRERQRLAQLGFKKSPIGAVFPGVDFEKLKIGYNPTKMPVEPKMKIGAIQANGQIELDFN